MKTRWIPVFIASGTAGFVGASCSHAAGTTITAMPPDPETRCALSAAPTALRDPASYHRLDPAKGYRLARRGSSGVACPVPRTAWELADCRDDIHFAPCYGAAGAATYLKTIMDAAELRAQGMDPAALKAAIEGHQREGTRRVPEKAGLSCGVAPVMRTFGPPDLKVHTMAMPHRMFYVPFVTHADIGAVPALADPATLRFRSSYGRAVPNRAA